MNYDEILTFQREVRTADTMGGSTIAWETVFQARARVVPIRGRELVNAQQLEQVTTHRITMRHYQSQEIDVSMSIVWTTNNGKLLNIIACPDPGPRRCVRELIAQEGGAV